MASRRAGFSERELWDAGLARRNKTGRLYDYFRRRITFPLCDARGRVLGFGGRAIGADQQPKYVNSTDGPIYHKGRQLFAADVARAAAAKAGRVVLCEGYTDVIAMHQAGLRNAVGLMGTSLTEDQVGELARLAPVVLLALDADSAGQEAMIRAAKVAAGRRLELRVVSLPAGQRPGGPARRGGRRRRCASASRRPCRSCASASSASSTLGDLDSGEGKDAAVGALRPVFAAAPGERAARRAARPGGRPARRDRRQAHRVAGAPSRGRVPAPPRSGAAAGPRAARRRARGRAIPSPRRSA